MLTYAGCVICHTQTEPVATCITHCTDRNSHHMVNLSPANFRRMTVTTYVIHRKIQMRNSLMKYASNVHINKSHKSLQKQDNA